MVHSNYHKEYEERRRHKQCNNCDQKAYRRKLCRSCLKYHIIMSGKFHCTQINCQLPVFAATLCQKHFRNWQMTCLLCNKKPFRRSICRTCYRKARAGDIEFPEEPTCTKCDDIVYLNDLCLKHFKSQFRRQCMMVGCDGKYHKRGLCCKHYFRERRINKGMK